jgi:predicted unusual protein kinase regulating ubiquinone biosynthesis (AarF/ABC1/UbiB family)
LLPSEYLNSLQKLQDRCPAYPNKDAFELFESELNRPFSDVLELEGTEPIAAASIGQVYKGRLKSK